MNVLSKHEEYLMESFIVLSFARKVLQKDLASMENSFFKLKEPYIQLIHVSLTTISKEMFEIKKQLHQRKMKIEFGLNDGTFTEFHCFFRGYEKTSKYLNTHLKMKVQERLSQFFIAANNKSS